VDWPSDYLDGVRVAGAQLNLTVGDLEGNESRIAEAMAWAEAEQADVLLLPELAVTGYPPEDLLLRDDFVDANVEVVRRLAAGSGDTTVVVGFAAPALGPPRGAPDAMSRNVANAAAIIGNGQWLGTYNKVLLPNYGVFDEDRYFVAGDRPDALWDMADSKVGVSICEDIWLPDGPPAKQAAAGAQLLLNINASPFHRGKAVEREAMLTERAKSADSPLVYLNTVGGQDELVFDGASVTIDRDGTLLHRSPQFAEDLFVVDVGEGSGRARGTAELLAGEAEIYPALVTGLRDYVRKNGFNGVVIGLSGGIDSALTAVIAVDALGADAVWGVGMPTRYSSEHSVTDARDLAARLGIRFDLVPIDPVFASHLESLDPLFAGTEFGVAEENLQARIRGALLMAVSNKFGPMVVATGNKSEMAVGYSTIYGDMVGGFAVLKDVFKTEVYRLAEWRNRETEMIPRSTIAKPPSAELRPDQKDSDSLPPYPELDAILERYVEDDLSPLAIIEAGFDEATVRRVVRMVDRNEYKRRQAAPGVKITTKAFGRDRRLPITNGYGR
jgi:NAD+ synthase (glutamine-hydrolysing)